MKFYQLYLAFVMLFHANIAGAQTGTYQIHNKSGAYCTIAIKKTGNKIKATGFAWWNTNSGQNGNFSGEGTFKANYCLLSGKSAEDPCKIKLNFNKATLNATFEDCLDNNLPEDFNGLYAKIAETIPGLYRIKTLKSYFYTNPNLKSQGKAYLISGNQIRIELENIKPDGWVFVNYRNGKGKITHGYMRQDQISFMR